MRRAVEPSVKRNSKRPPPRLPRERHPRSSAERREAIHHGARPLPLDLAQFLDPIEYLVVELDLRHEGQ